MSSLSSIYVSILKRMEMLIWNCDTITRTTMIMYTCIPNLISIYFFNMELLSLSKNIQTGRQTTKQDRSYALNYENCLFWHTVERGNTVITNYGTPCIFEYPDLIVVIERYNDRKYVNNIVGFSATVVFLVVPIQFVTIYSVELFLLWICLNDTLLLLS